MMSPAKMDIQVSLIMMIMEMKQNMIWVGKYLEIIVQKMKKTCRFIVLYVLENILRQIAQISSLVVPNNSIT